MMCGWEGPEGLREWRKRSGPIVGLFSPETKQVDARARQASGTGTVEWRSASVGMPMGCEVCQNSRPGLTCQPSRPRSPTWRSPPWPSAHRCIRSVRYGSRLLTPSCLQSVDWTKHTLLDSVGLGLAQALALAMGAVRSSRRPIRLSTIQHATLVSVPPVYRRQTILCSSSLAADQASQPSRMLLGGPTARDRQRMQAGLPSHMIPANVFTNRSGSSQCTCSSGDKCHHHMSTKDPQHLRDDLHPRACAASPVSAMLRPQRHVGNAAAQKPRHNSPRSYRTKRHGHIVWATPPRVRLQAQRRLQSARSTFAL